MSDSNRNDKPDQDLHFERSAVHCKRCLRPFSHFMIEEIDGLTQLRCADVLIREAEVICLHCGWVFHWNIRTKDIEKMAVAYGALVKMYVAE